MRLELFAQIKKKISSPERNYFHRLENVEVKRKNIFSQFQWFFYLNRLDFGFQPNEFSGCHFHNWRLPGYYFGCKIDFPVNAAIVVASKKNHAVINRRISRNTGRVNDFFSK